MKRFRKLALPSLRVLRAETALEAFEDYGKMDFFRHCQLEELVLNRMTVNAEGRLYEPGDWLDLASDTGKSLKRVLCSEQVECFKLFFKVPELMSGLEILGLGYADYVGLQDTFSFSGAFSTRSTNRLTVLSEGYPLYPEYLHGTCLSANLLHIQV